MLPDASVYTDFAGLTALRARAQQNAGETVGEVAEQFEAIFLQMMLKSMRQTVKGDPLLGQGGELYADLFDQQIALELAGSNRFGLAQSLLASIQAFIPGEASQGTKESKGRIMSGISDIQCICWAIVGTAWAVAWFAAQRVEK